MFFNVLTMKELTNTSNISHFFMGFKMLLGGVECRPHPVLCNLVVEFQVV